MRLKQKPEKNKHVSMSVFEGVWNGQRGLSSSVWEGWEVIGISVILAYSGLLRICLAVLQVRGSRQRWRRRLSSHLVCPFM